MPTIIPKYICKYCGNEKNTKNEFYIHINICKYRCLSEKERQEKCENEEIILSSPQIIKLVLDLSVKYENMERKMLDLIIENQQLKKKMERIQTNQSTQTRKNILEYLKISSSPNKIFSKWINNIPVSKENLTTFFDKNLLDCFKQMLTDEFASQKLPIVNYIQKPNNIYIYEFEGENIFNWKIMTDQDWKKWINIILKKLKNIYYEWKKENQQEIDNNDKLFEQVFSYNDKFNKLEKDVSQDTKQIKQYVVSRIQKSLQIV